MKKKIKYNLFIFIILFYFFVFQDPIESITPAWVTYFDEIYALMSIPIFLYMIIKKRKIILPKGFKKIFFLLLIMSIIGMTSSLIYRYQIFINCLFDFVLCTKFILAIFVSYTLFGEVDLCRYEKAIVVCMKILVLLLFSLEVIDIIYNVNPTKLERHGLRTIQSVYTNPTRTAAAAFLVLCMITVFQKKCKNLFFYQFMLIFITFMTLRAKAIGAIIIYLGIQMLTKIRKEKLKISKTIPLAILAVLFAWTQFQDYYIANNRASRYVLTYTSFILSKDYFPLGTGFATFASAYSKYPYSPIYSMYGLNSIPGLSMSHNKNISDTFWPTILGQFGFLGFICYLFILIQLFIKIQKMYEMNINFYLSTLCMFAYLFISSIAESAYFSPLAIGYSLCIGVIFAQNKHLGRKKNE